MKFKVYAVLITTTLSILGSVSADQNIVININGERTTSSAIKDRKVLLQRSIDTRKDFLYVGQGVLPDGYLIRFDHLYNYVYAQAILPNMPSPQTGLGPGDLILRIEQSDLGSIKAKLDQCGWRYSWSKGIVRVDIIIKRIWLDYRWPNFEAEVIVSEPVPSEASRTSLNDLSVLEKLHELKSKGILTDQEYEAKKRELLHR